MWLVAPHATQRFYTGGCHEACTANSLHGAGNDRHKRRGKRCARHDERLQFWSGRSEFFRRKVRQLGGLTTQFLFDALRTPRKGFRQLKIYRGLQQPYVIKGEISHDGLDIVSMVCLLTSSTEKAARY